MKLKKGFLKTLIIGPVLIFSGQSVNICAQSADKLWYRSPASYFEETLLLGNGRMGASVFGAPEREQIWLNDITLWSGEPVDPWMNPEAYLYLPAVREALAHENYRKADSVNRKLQGSFSESYAPLGTMYISFRHEAPCSDYYRELDIDRAVAKVTYRSGETDYTREYFVSYPARAMFIRLTAGKKGKLDFDISLESLLNYRTFADKGNLRMTGRAPVHAEPQYRGEMRDAVVYNENRGTRFTALVKVISTDGSQVQGDSTLSVRNASEAVLMVALGTSFNGFDRDPATEGLNSDSIADAAAGYASARDYQALKNEHIADYQTYFRRVSLELGNTTAPDLPTDERLKRYTEGAEDKKLEILYFQFGRYLLISSSRTPGVPANLQGLWNPYVRPPWSSNYTVNINVEENYWLAENTNLSEMHKPLLDFIGNVAATGAVTAKSFYGVQEGWAACHNSDIWAMSNPVGDFGNGDPVWANWNMGGTWLSTHLWEHFIFTRDTVFLRETGYPLMKGAALFCLGWVTEDSKGNLITSPSTSPENKYITTDGYHGATLYGGTADLAMIRELFIQTDRAAEVLGNEDEFRGRLQEALKRLHPYRIGDSGNLQEWYFDWEDSEPKHRHQSHLFGLYPGHHITTDLTPDLAAACRRTLELRGDESTGWSKGWRINLWARLGDGEHAYLMYRDLLKIIEPDAIRKKSGGGGTYPNLMDAHPPFQIDGNFGGAAAVAEMIVQSTVEEIKLLPALPAAWSEGRVTGLKARGGFEVSMDWAAMRPSSVRISSAKGGKTVLSWNGEKKEISLEPGGTREIKW